MPATGSSRQIRRTASSSSRADRPPGSGVPVPGAWPGSQTSMSTERKTASQSSRAISNASSRQAVEATLADLGHLVGAHVLLGHPGQRLRLGPVAAQPDLEEPVAAQRTRLDQPPHRLAVAVERAERDVAGVGVRVEVDHRDPAEAEVPGHAGRVGQRDRVVAAEHQRDRARRGDGVDRLLELRPAPARSPPAASPRRRRRRPGCPAARRPAARGAAASRRAAGSRPAGWPRPEPGAGPVRGAAVERRPDDHHVRRRQRRRRRRGRPGRRRGR